MVVGRGAARRRRVLSQRCRREPHALAVAPPAALLEHAQAQPRRVRRPRIRRQAAATRGKRSSGGDRQPLDALLVRRQPLLLDGAVARLKPCGVRVVRFASLVCNSQQRGSGHAARRRRRRRDRRVVVRLAERHRRIEVPPHLRIRAPLRRQPLCAHAVHLR